MPYSLDFNERLRKFRRLHFLPSFILSNSSYQLPYISIGSENSPLITSSLLQLFQFLLSTNLAPPSFVIIIAAVFWVHKQGIYSRAINNYSTQHLFSVLSYGTPIDICNLFDVSLTTLYPKSQQLFRPTIFCLNSQHHFGNRLFSVYLKLLVCRHIIVKLICPSPAGLFRVQCIPEN